MKFALLIFLTVSNLIAFAQIDYSSKGISFSLPDGFKTADTRADEFATFNRNGILQISFGNGCNRLVEKHKSNLSKETTADLCFETQFVKMKSGYSATWTLSPKDTIINTLNCEWAELHSTVEKQEYYLVYLLVKGVKYKYEVLISGHLNNKKDDLKTFGGILTSYKEVR